MGKRKNNPEVKAKEWKYKKRIELTRKIRHNFHVINWHYILFFQNITELLLERGCQLDFNAKLQRADQLVRKTSLCGNCPNFLTPNMVANPLPPHRVGAFLGDWILFYFFFFHFHSFGYVTGSSNMLITYLDEFYPLFSSPLLSGLSKLPFPHSQASKQVVLRKDGGFKRALKENGGGREQTNGKSKRCVSTFRDPFTYSMKFFSPCYLTMQND